jgi:hypothetical protein
MIWHIVTKYARQTRLVDQLADMRRTCAKLCRESGGDLADSISAGPRFHPDDRTLPGIAAEFEGGGE